MNINTDTLGIPVYDMLYWFNLVFLLLCFIIALMCFTLQQNLIIKIIIASQLIRETIF